MSHEALQPENDQAKSPERYQTDSQKVVQRHLEDENHIISDEDIRNVRIGVTEVAPMQTEKILDKLVEEVEKENKEEDDVAQKDNPINPWDTIQH
jgi:hypothetical protein